MHWCVRARQGWERTPPPFAFLTFICAGLDSFLRTKNFRQNQRIVALIMELVVGAGGTAPSKSCLSPQYAVVKIVREKYLKRTAFESQEQLQAFLSELYVYLMDQMHVALNQVGRNLGDLRHSFTMDPGLDTVSGDGGGTFPSWREAGSCFICCSSHMWVLSRARRQDPVPFVALHYTILVVGYG